MELSQNIQQALDNISIDTYSHGSVTYAKARTAIDSFAKNREEKRKAKLLVIELLNGKLQHGKNRLFGQTLVANFVEFPDGSKAKF